jgi:hypothetical protein
VLGLSVAAWTASIAGWEWRAGSRLMLFLVGGEVRVLAGEVDSIGWEYDSAGFAWPLWRLPRLVNLGDWKLWALVAPLWIPATLAGTTFCAVSHHRRHERARMRLGACVACAYDLTGITGPCPECGSKNDVQAMYGETSP